MRGRYVRPRSRCLRREAAARRGAGLRLLCAPGAAAAPCPGSWDARAAGPGLAALPVRLARARGTGTPSRAGDPTPREQAAGWRRPKCAVNPQGSISAGCQRLGTVPLFAGAGEAAPGLGTEHLPAERPVPSCLQQGPRATETERSPRWTQLSSGRQRRAAEPGRTGSLVPSSPLRCAAAARRERGLVAARGWGCGGISTCSSPGFTQPGLCWWRLGSQPARY